MGHLVKFNSPIEDSNYFLSTNKQVCCQSGVGSFHYIFTQSIPYLKSHSDNYQREYIKNILKDKLSTSISKLYQEHFKYWNYFQII